ncbi:unnamed protein product [Eruca vesicaria subsp. sativa]|uniref:Uncharacterized protein n=1 Tax=Eruca vesicaria subsp. sativa TaxID=29727 RepID=A0ABC8IY74_ERUVS|nr:unnamed protein product [Eruca vesicaria subsp. sativa]
MTISDATNTAEFVVFDTVTTKLINICAANTSNQQVSVAQCLREIGGSTLTFQLSLSHFNLSAIHQCFAVSCIFFDNNQRPPHLNFEFHLLELSKEASHFLQSSPVNQSESDGNADVGGGRGEPLDPSQTSVDGRNTSEDGPVRRKLAMARSHRLAKNKWSFRQNTC